MSESSTGGASGNSTCQAVADAVADASSSASSIFAIEDLDMLLATWIMVSLIVFTIGFESALHHMEKKLMTHTHYLKILSKVYKELMILGFISFSILIVLQVFTLSENSVQTLEFVHVWFFFIAILYATHVLVYMFLARRDKRRYDVATCMRIPELLEGLKQSQATLYVEARDTRWHVRAKRAFYSLTQFAFVSSVASSLYQPPETQLYQQIQFHIVRSLFIRTYDLSSDFDFAKYLRRCMSKHITEQLDIKEQSWLVLILFLFINVARVELEDTYGATDYNVITLWLFLVVPYFLLGLSFVAVIGIEHAKKQLLMKVGVETVDDLEQALLRSRAKMGNVVTKPANARSSIVAQHRLSLSGASAIDQQTALNKYLPLLLKGLFPYDKPALFPIALEMIMLTQCFFIGLAFIFHIRQSFQLFSAGIAVLYVLFTMLPHLIVLLVVAPHVMTTFVFVHSVGYVKKDVLNHVVEFMEESAELKSEIRDYLQNWALTHQMTLGDLFLKLSGGSTTIAVGSLQASLKSVNISLNQSQVSRLCRMINLEQNGRIDLREFTLFFFGSEGSSALSLIPINKRTQGQLALVAESNANLSIDQEVRARVRSELLIQANAVSPKSQQPQSHAALGGIELMLPDQPPADFHPNALHDPQTPVPMHLAASHGIPASPHGEPSMAVSHVPDAPLPRPTTHHGIEHLKAVTHAIGHMSAQLSHAHETGLDLRHSNLGSSKHLEHNLFISHTLEHGMSHHGTGATSAKKEQLKNHVAIANDRIDLLDFSSCFHLAKTRCCRCEDEVLVSDINRHVLNCSRLGPVQTQRAGLVQEQLPAARALRAASTSSHDDASAEALQALKPVEKAIKPSPAAAVDDMLISRRGSSRRQTGRASQRKPINFDALVKAASEQKAAGLPAVTEEAKTGALVTPPIAIVNRRESAAHAKRRRSLNHSG